MKWWWLPSGVQLGLLAERIRHGVPNSAVLGLQRAGSMVGNILASADGRRTARGFLASGRLPRVGCSTMRGYSQPSP
eukprot:14785139-Heterocapsa_arctica.AAC.1